MDSGEVLLPPVFAFGSVVTALLYPSMHQLIYISKKRSFSTSDIRHRSKIRLSVGGEDSHNGEVGS